MTDLSALLAPIRERLAKANPNNAEWCALTDPGDPNTAPAWIVDADDLEVRVDATYAAGKLAVFIAAAPADVVRLLAAVEAVVRGHRPHNVPYNNDQYCNACRGDVGQRVKYPCPTVRALTAALEGNDK